VGIEKSQEPEPEKAIKRVYTVDEFIEMRLQEPGAIAALRQLMDVLNRLAVMESIGKQADSEGIA